MRLVVDPPHKIASDKTTPSPLNELLAFEHVRPLALEIGTLLSELSKTRHALWQREAELAAGVPVTVQPDETHLAGRLESVLRGGTEAIGADSAGLYLLDDATTSLKLRAMHNLPRSRFLDAPRTLLGAVADLEALLGHAVVMDETALLPHWKCPEEFPSAVCVPVSTRTTPLGTLWVYSKKQRDFTSDQTNLLEIVAGRIAADLEREMLLAAGASLQKDERGQRSIARWRKDRLPQFAPVSEEWDLAGWASEAGPGNEFFDWNVLNDGRIVFGLGAVNGDEHAAPLNVAALQAAWRSHLDHIAEPAALLSKLDETIRTSSAGDLTAIFGQGNLDEAGRLEFASAGKLASFLWTEAGRHPLTPLSSPLGTGDLYVPASHYFKLQKGDMLILFSPGACNLVDEGGLHIGPDVLLKTLQRHRHRPAAQLMTVLRELLTPRLNGKRDTATIMMAKRR